MLHTLFFFFICFTLLSTLDIVFYHFHYSDEYTVDMHYSFKFHFFEDKWLRKPLNSYWVAEHLICEVLAQVFFFLPILLGCLSFFKNWFVKIFTIIYRLIFQRIFFLREIWFLILALLCYSFAGMQLEKVYSLLIFPVGFFEKTVNKKINLFTSRAVFAMLFLNHSLFWRHQENKLWDSVICYYFTYIFPQGYLKSWTLAVPLARPEAVLKRNVSGAF